ADPGELTMAEVEQVVHEQSQRLRLIGHHRMAHAGIGHGNRDQVRLYGLDRLDKVLFDLAENGDTEQFQAFELLVQLTNAEIIFGAQKKRIITLLQQTDVQTVLHGAEKIALSVQTQTGAQNESHIGRGQ